MLTKLLRRLPVILEMKLLEQIFQITLQNLGKLEGYEEVFSKGYVKDYPLEIQNLDGSITPVLYNASIYKDESGDIGRCFCCCEGYNKT